MNRKLDLRNLIMFVIAAVVISLDQYTKHLIRTNLPIGESISPIAALANILSFTHIQNQGAAFGMFPAASSIFLVVAVVVVLAISFFSGQLARSSALLRLALGLQLGGAAGNLIDRLTQQGQVTDFINFHVFAVFNMADMSIVAGTILLAYYALVADEGAAEEADVADDAPDEVEPPQPADASQVPEDGRH